MVNINLLKPYYIKAETAHLRVILGYQYFEIVIEEEVYQFIPIEANEIRINRTTQKIENKDAKFAFQKGNDIIYVSMNELIDLPDFLHKLYNIVKTYFVQPKDANKKDPFYESDLIIDELEHQNIKRLIDKSLDERDEDTFYALLEVL